MPVPPGSAAPPAGAAPQGPDLEAIAAQAPMIADAVDPKRVLALVKQFNDTVEKLGGKDDAANEVPDMEWAPPQGVKKLQGMPFPPEVYVYLYVLDVATQNTLRAAGMGALAKKYDLALADLTDNGGIAYTQARLKAMAGDKRLAEIMRNPPAQGAAPSPPVEEMAPETPAKPPAADEDMMAQGMA